MGVMAIVRIQYGHTDNMSLLEIFSLELIYQFPKEDLKSTALKEFTLNKYR